MNPFSVSVPDISDFICGFALQFQRNATKESRNRPRRPSYFRWPMYPTLYVPFQVANVSYAIHAISGGQCILRYTCHFRWPMYPTLYMPFQVANVSYAIHATSGGQCILRYTCHFIRRQFTSSAVTMSFSNLIRELVLFGNEFCCWKTHFSFIISMQLG